MTPKGVYSLKMRVPMLIVFVLAVVTALPTNEERIVGGSTVDISRYRFAAALLYSRTGAGVFAQACGGTLITSRSILTAAQCVYWDQPTQWRGRLGSTRASAGGILYTFNRILVHPYFNIRTFDSDVAILYTPNIVSIGGNIAIGGIASDTFNLLDNSQVWAVGWGLVNYGGAPSDQLRHVQIWSINQNICRQRYAELGRAVTYNMLCSGWLDIGGRDACIGDVGGPLVYTTATGVTAVVGITSWAERCALPRYPRVNTRVSSFSRWIQMFA